MRKPLVSGAGLMSLALLTILGAPRPETVVVAQDQPSGLEGDPAGLRSRLPISNDAGPDAAGRRRRSNRRLARQCLGVSSAAHPRGRQRDRERLHAGSTGHGIQRDRQIPPGMGRTDARRPVRMVQPRRSLLGVCGMRVVHQGAPHQWRWTSGKRRARHRRRLQRQRVADRQRRPATDRSSSSPGTASSCCRSARAASAVDSNDTNHLSRPAGIAVYRKDQ